STKRDRKCVIYGSLTAWQTTIEIQRCTSCRPESRQYAGPDCQEWGLFNFNNARLYTHELLNGFTNAMTATETPFNSYRTIVVRNYAEEGSTVAFVKTPLGHDPRTAWFSFSRIQALGDSFVCDKCGPDPNIIIFDGVTAGFNAKHITQTLRPPTLLDATSPVRTNVVVPASPLTFVPNEKLRSRAQQAVRWRK
ncbi:hypothetical protein AURDEDRAFT_20794, partial [Auricularia subglabra TFB-10046 SS5]